MQHTELLKGTLQTIILKLLEDHGRMYGYEITQKAKELSDGLMNLTEGALYPALHKLEAEGLVRTERVLIGKRVRKYYFLTPVGRDTIRIKIREFIDYVRIIQKTLQIKPIFNS